MPSFCFVLSCRSPKYKDRLGYRVLCHSGSPQDHVPHGGCGPWKHMLARSGFAELVPVVVHLSAINVAPCVLGGVCPRACKKLNELLEVRFQQCLLVPLDSCGPWKHLLARRGYVKLVPVGCIFNQKVLRTILSRPNWPPEDFWKPKPIRNHRRTLIPASRELFTQKIGNAFSVI